MYFAGVHEPLGGAEHEDAEPVKEVSDADPKGGLRV